VTSSTVQTVQVYRIYIRATPEAVWAAITDPQWSEQYGYRSPAHYELRPGGRYHGLASPEMTAAGAPEVAVAGEVVEVDPPRRLVQTWHPAWGPRVAAEPATRLTYEIDETSPGVSRLTVIHDVTDAPTVAAMVAGKVPNAGGGWSEVLSDLKTLLETGKTLAG